MERNNIFNFATSELSQDAFLCWSINWINESENYQLYEYGKAMLDLLLGDKKQDCYKEVRIYRQYAKIDVLILFKDSEKNPHALIIEDKVGTSEHGNQMLRYKEEFSRKAENDEILKEYKKDREYTIHLTYVKSGVLYDEEENVMEAKGATVVGLDELISLIPDYSELSDILLDFNDYIQEIKSNRDAIKDQIEKNCKCEEALKDAYGQFYFLDRIFTDRKIEDIKNRRIDKVEGEKPPVYVNHIYSGYNKSGAPWTQYSFWAGQYPDRGKNKEEYHFLFWRVDCNSKGKYYIALRHYDENRKKDDHYSVKRKRFVYRKFREYADEHYNNNEDYKEICEDIGKRDNYKESDLIYILVENVKDLKFCKIKEIIREITDSFKNKFIDKCNLYEGMDDYIQKSE